MPSGSRSERSTEESAPSGLTPMPAGLAWKHASGAPMVLGYQLLLSCAVESAVSLYSSVAFLVALL